MARIPDLVAPDVRGVGHAHGAVPSSQSTMGTKVANKGRLSDF